MSIFQIKKANNEIDVAKVTSERNFALWACSLIRMRMMCRILLATVMDMPKKRTTWRMNSSVRQW